jgi:hypothetical protein
VSLRDATAASLRAAGHSPAAADCLAGALFEDYRDDALTDALAALTGDEGVGGDRALQALVDACADGSRVGWGRRL